VLGIGGVVAFVIGSMLLVDTDTPGFDVSLPLVAGIAVASLAFTMLAGRLAMSSRRARARSGAEAMVGQTARVLDWQAGHGHVFAAGERWSADGDSGLMADQIVSITHVHGVHLTVRAAATAPALQPLR
jgi:membrane-bound serine protease (ClpP class)